jgi:hypothetical protein
MERKPEQALAQPTVILQDESLKQFQGGFTAIPNRVLQNTELSLGARMTYAMLLKYAWQDNFCFPAQESLAHDLGVTDRSVRTWLNELKAAGLITWKQQGLNRPNIYVIHRLPERKIRAQQGPENFSGPDRKSTSGQDRKQASDYEYSSTNTHHVNVPVESNLLRSYPQGSHPQDELTDEEISEDGFIDRVAEALQDHNPRSRTTYRVITRALGQEVTWGLVANAREADRDGIVDQSKAAYFVGTAKKVAREQGITLRFGSKPK